MPLRVKWLHILDSVSSLALEDLEPFQKSIDTYIIVGRQAHAWYWKLLSNSFNEISSSTSNYLFPISIGQKVRNSPDVNERLQ